MTLPNQIHRTLIILRRKAGNLGRELSHLCILDCIPRRTPRIYGAKLDGKEVEWAMGSVSNVSVGETA